MQNMMLKLAHRIPNVIASYLNTLYIRNTSFAILTYVTFVMDSLPVRYKIQPLGICCSPMILF